MVLEERGKRKERIGFVVSDRMDKTVVVRLERLTQHPLYRKSLKVARRIKAHDEENQCAMGDKVRIMETRPFSRDKRWRVVEILERVQVETEELES
jgi:small subunit ribosomal protein S17